jgi:phosphatidylglycerophosphate synthase
MDPSESSTERRPIPQREWGMMKRIASRMAQTRISPNAISVSSAVFAVGSGIALAGTSCPALSRAPLLWLLGAVLIVLRLLANMFDGMVAIERNEASPVGELYNEVPDRFSDVAILVGAGYAAGGSILLGFWAALLAVGVAYVRAMGVAAGASQVFLGPMAKPHRMWVLIITAVACASLPENVHSDLFGSGRGLMEYALLLVCVGCAVTIVRRLKIIGRELRKARLQPSP